MKRVDAQVQAGVGSSALFTLTPPRKAKFSQTGSTAKCVELAYPGPLCGIALSELRGNQGKSSTFDFALFFEFGEGLVDFLSGKDLVATSALVGFFGESFINEVVGKIDRVKEH
jgi:hypothetical protein